MDNSGEMLADFARRGLIPSRLATGPNSAPPRAILVRALLDAPDWDSWLARLLPTPKGKFDVVVTPAQYLKMVSSPRPLSLPSVEGKSRRLIVDGDVVIAHAYAPALPPAVIRGMLQLGGCPELKEVDFTVFGQSSIENCPALNYVRGEYFSDLNLSSIGVSKLGADLHVHRNLTVSACAALKSVNCVTEGRFTAKECMVLESSSPAFYSGKMATFETCPSLRQLRGTVSRLSLGYDIDSQSVDRHLLETGTDHLPRAARTPLSPVPRRKEK